MEDHKTFIEDALAEMDHISRLVHENWAALDPKQLNHRPNGQWSIADNLKHLMVVNASYFPIFEQLQADSKIPRTFFLKKILGKWIGQWILRGVSRNRNQKSKTFAVWEPELFQEEGDLLNRFYIEQQRLKEYIKASQPLLEQDAFIHSPANHSIQYSLKDAIRILIEHEWRHLNQGLELDQK